MQVDDRGSKTPATPSNFAKDKGLSEPQRSPSRLNGAQDTSKDREDPLATGSEAVDATSKAPVSALQNDAPSKGRSVKQILLHQSPGSKDAERIHGSSRPTVKLKSDADSQDAIPSAEKHPQSSVSSRPGKISGRTLFLDSGR